MIVLLETPTTILGTLWGVVLMMRFFHFTAEISSWVVTIMLLGSLIGLPLIGRVADRYGSKPWMIALGAGACFVMVILMFFFQPTQNLWVIGLLFFGLGFFCSCQTLGFHWITANMKAELIGRNSAFNSVVFMAVNGGLKQLSVVLLVIPAIWMTTSGSSGNLLTIILISMLIVFFYALIRRFIFRNMLFE